MINQQILTKIADQMLIDIDNFCDKYWKDEYRGHLGFSMIGDDCQRKLWYGFRWCKMPRPQPRLKRLFNRGHLEEDRFINYLKGIGCEVNPFDMSYRLFVKNRSEFFITKVDNAIAEEQLSSEQYIDVSDDLYYVGLANEQGLTYPVQWRVSAVHGHSGGSLDGRGYLPKGYGLDEEILFEFKTHNAKSFADLQKRGMRLSKPTHYAQCCSYGYMLGLNYVCYVAVNKDNDDLHLEIVPLNHKTGEVLVQKAERIVIANEPPPHLHENPTFWLCKTCNYFSICHAKEPIDKNCRSCKHSEPVKDGQWWCNMHGQILTKDIIVQEYGCWESICG